jgi:hypothetical protein
MLPNWRGSHQTNQSPHRAVQRMPVVPPELRIRAFERRVSVGLWLLDTDGKEMSVLNFGVSVAGGINERTRSYVPSSTDCAATSSLILPKS